MLLTMAPKPVSILFIDRTGGTLAPMAAALLRAAEPKRFTAHGAGDGTMHAACAAELQRRGVKADNLSLQPLPAWQTPELSVTIDVVVRLGAAVKNVPAGLYGAPAKVDWLVDDPADAHTPEQAAWKARKAADQLMERMAALGAAELPVARGELQNALNAIGNKFET